MFRFASFHTNAEQTNFGGKYWLEEYEKSLGKKLWSSRELMFIPTPIIKVELIFSILYPAVVSE